MVPHTIAAYVLLMLCKDSKVLLLKRSPTHSYAPGHYCLVGGRVEANESFTAAMIREASEEVGITVKESDLKLVHTFYRKNPMSGSEFVALIFTATSWQGEPFNKEPNKHTEVVWFSLDALPTPLIPAHYDTLALIKKGINYSEYFS